MGANDFIHAKSPTITAHWTTEKVKDIQSLIDTTKELIQHNMDRIDVEKNHRNDIYTVLSQN